MTQSDSHPAAFGEWLSGSCFYVEPLPWKCRAGAAGRVELIPDVRLILLFCAIAIPFMVGIAGFHFWNSGRGISGIVDKAIPGLVGAIALLGLGALLVKSLNERRKGPYLVYSPAGRTVRLQRRGTDVIRLADVLGLRMVSGNWVGPAGNQTKADKPVTELQLVVQTPSGPMSYAIVGGMEGGSISAHARSLARLHKRCACRWRSSNNIKGSRDRIH